MGLEDRVANGITTLGLQHSAEQVVLLVRYLELIIRWNKVTNLTAITDPLEMVPRHLLDSLAINHFLSGQRICDVGSGAGLPGVPLALLNPDKDFILLDSNGKKTRFMMQAKIELSLHNVEIIQTRVEDYQATFDHVVSRAFRALGEFADSCRHLVISGQGNLLAMQGASQGPSQASSENDPEPIPGFQQITHRLSVPGLDAQRYLVELSP